MRAGLEPAPTCLQSKNNNPDKNLSFAPSVTAYFAGKLNFAGRGGIADYLHRTAPDERLDATGAGVVFAAINKRE